MDEDKRTLNLVIPICLRIRVLKLILNYMAEDKSTLNSITALVYAGIPLHTLHIVSVCINDSIDFLKGGTGHLERGEHLPILK